MRGRLFTAGARVVVMTKGLVTVRRRPAVSSKRPSGVSASRAREGVLLRRRGPSGADEGVSNTGGRPSVRETGPSSPR